MFGTILRLLRENAGLTQEDLAEKVACSPSLVSALEMGHMPIRPATDDRRYSPAAIADLEKDASKIHDWEPRLIPGLLQTRDYARFMYQQNLPFGTDEQIEINIASRMARQEILIRENPPTGWFVIEESALYREFGGREVMREQLDRLLALSELPNIFIQIMPFANAGHPGAEGPLRIIEYPHFPAVRYTEGWYSGRMTETRDEVSKGMTHFDIIRSCALSFDQSRQFIRTVMEDRYGGEQPRVA